MKLFMTAEKTKLPPMMAMVLRYGTAARLWSHARSIMADPAPEVARARTLRAQYSFGGDTGSEKSSENMHKVATEACQPRPTLWKKGLTLCPSRKRARNVRLTKKNKWIESPSSPGKNVCLASSEIFKICQCQTMKNPIPHNSRQYEKGRNRKMDGLSACRCSDGVFLRIK